MSGGHNGIREHLRRERTVRRVQAWAETAAKLDVDLVSRLARTRRKPVVYIAGPSSGEDTIDVKQNVLNAEKLAREVVRLGAVPLTPRSIGASFHGIGTYDYWCIATLELLRRADAVLFTEDWSRSKGACGEWEDASKADMPMFFVGENGLNELRDWLDIVRV